MSDCKFIGFAIEAVFRPMNRWQDGHEYIITTPVRNMPAKCGPDR
ncbi:MAG: hypothetical protein OS112_04075 [Methanoregula sp.]|nr:MAG: hypothetical protein OS112_04075 [Methanoregula sp.]